MIYQDKEKVVAFDCDDTLVLWGDKPFEPGPGKERFVDQDGEVFYFRVHAKHVQKLKGYARSGYFVIVWSMSGSAWAKAIVEQLKLQDYVSFVTAKPQYLFDDMPLNEAFGKRMFFQPKKVKDESST
jgi:phosphoserine phosphatase